MSFESRFIFRTDLPPPMKRTSVERNKSFTDTWKRKLSSSLQLRNIKKTKSMSKSLRNAFSKNLKTSISEDTEPPSYCNVGLECKIPVVPNFLMIQMQKNGNISKTSTMSSFNGQEMFKQENSLQRFEQIDLPLSEHAFRRSGQVDFNNTNFYGVESENVIRTNYSCRVPRSFRKGKHSYSSNELSLASVYSNVEVSMRNGHQDIIQKNSSVSKRRGCVDYEQKFSEQYGSSVSLPDRNAIKPKIPDKPLYLISGCQKSQKGIPATNNDVNNNAKFFKSKIISSKDGSPSETNVKEKYLPATDNYLESLRRKEFAQKLSLPYNLNTNIPIEKGEPNYKLISYGINLSDITNLKLRHVSRGVNVNS